MPDEKSPIDRLLEVLVFAPVGFALEASTLVPELVERGRRTIDAQVGTARVLGHFALDQGQRELDRRWAAWRGGEGATPAAPPTVDVVIPEPGPAMAEPTAGEAAGVPGPGPATHDMDAAAGLAIPDYDSLAASQVVPRLPGLGPEELEAVRRYEVDHRARRTILSRVAQLQAGG